MVMQRKPRSHFSRRRVFCFGDSITAGVVPMSTSGLSPYGMHLRNALHMHPGYESTLVQTLHYQSLQLLSNQVQNLNHILDKIAQTREPLLIILVGTNDLTAKGATCDMILREIIKLHSNAHKRGIQTMAVGLPPSLLQEERESIKILAGEVNRGLRNWVQESSAKNKVAFVPFPLQAFDASDKFWAPDGFHLTQEGYKFIGSSLVSPVKKALKRRI